MPGLGTADQGQPRRAGSVRGRLVRLTVSLLIPALLAMGFLLAGADRESRGRLYQQLLTTARALNGAVDRQAATGISVAETLATDQALIDGDWAAFHARARRAMERRSGWIVVADANGQQVINTLVPYGRPLPRIQRTPAEAQAYASGRNKVSDLLMGPVAGKPVITVGTPITVQGKFYVLSYVVESASFTSVFRQQRVPDTWVATLLDNKQRVIARSRLNEKFTGAQASADMTENLRRSTEGVNRSVSLEGVPTMVAYTRSPQTGWTLVVAIPRKELTSTVNHSVALGPGSSCCCWRWESGWPWPIRAGSTATCGGWCRTPRRSGGARRSRPPRPTVSKRSPPSTPPC